MRRSKTQPGVDGIRACSESAWVKKENHGEAANF